MKRRFKCYENNIRKYSGKIREEEDFEINGREGLTPRASFCTLRVKEAKCEDQDKKDGRRNEFNGLPTTYSSLQVMNSSKDQKKVIKVKKKKSVTETEKVFREMSEKLCGHMRGDILGPSLPWSTSSIQDKSESSSIVQNDWEDSLEMIVERTVRDSLCSTFDNYMKETIEKYIKFCVETMFRQFPIEITAGIKSGATADATVDTMVIGTMVDTMVDATTDAMSAITADIAADVAADVVADVAADMAADMAAEVVADMAAMTSNTTVNIASEITPFITQSLHEFSNLHIIKSSEAEEFKESNKLLQSAPKEITKAKSITQQGKFTSKTQNDVKKRYKEVRSWPKRKESSSKPVSAPPRIRKKSETHIRQT